MAVWAGLGCLEFRSFHQKQPVHCLFTSHPAKTLKHTGSDKDETRAQTRQLGVRPTRPLNSIDLSSLHEQLFFSDDVTASTLLICSRAV